MLSQSDKYPFIWNMNKCRENNAIMEKRIYKKSKDKKKNYNNGHKRLGEE